MTEAIDHFKTELKSALPFLPGGLFSDVKREAALTNLAKNGMPTKRHEDWRYSDPSPMTKGTLAPTKKLSLGEVNQPAYMTDWPKLIFVNGHMVQNECASLNGIECFDFTDSLDGPAWCQDMIRLRDKDPLGDLNVAFLQGGAAIKITKEFSKDGIEIINIISGDTHEACQTRNLIIVDEKVEVSLATQIITEGSIGWVNHENHIVVHNEATLRHYSDLSKKALGFVSTTERVHVSGGTYDQYCLAMNQRALRHQILVDMAAPQSYSNLYGAFLTRDTETSDTLTNVHHQTPGAFSEQFFRGVGRHKSSGAFQGKVIVEKDAQKTIANQSCKAMILDPETEVNIKPQLLIYADDVKCAHGATVGELDKESLFYMVQRGISPQRAQTMLINAFLATITEFIGVESIKARFETKIENWMAEEEDKQNV